MGAAGLKQTALTNATGISQSKISRFVNGEVKPKLEEIDKLAKACGVSRYALIGGTEIAAEHPTDCLVSIELDAGVKWLAYFASALTNLSEAERTDIFEDAAVVREACEGIRAFLYEPRHFTDPVHNKDVTAERVFIIDHAQVSRSDFVVLHAGAPSFGAGQELEIARNAGIPILVLRPEHVALTRMVKGSSARIREVAFSGRDHLRTLLPDALGDLVRDLAARHTGAARPADASRDSSFARRLAAARSAIGFDEETLARHVGLRREAIVNFESGDDPNPSLVVLTRLAQTLRTTVAHLADGVRPHIEEVDPVLRDSKANLNRWAATKHVPHDEVQRLWDAEVISYSSQRLKVAEARSAPVSEDAWQQRHAEMKNGARPRQQRLLDD
jgi:transcriptional regulator with XRE-family HTH domain